MKLISVAGEEYQRRELIGQGSFSQVEDVFASLSSFSDFHCRTSQLAMHARHLSSAQTKSLAGKCRGLCGPSQPCLIIHTLATTLQSLRVAQALQGAPYLLPIYAAFQDEHFLYQLMELCPGGELRFEKVWQLLRLTMIGIR